MKMFSIALAVVAAFVSINVAEAAQNDSVDTYRKVNCENLEKPSNVQIDEERDNEAKSALSALGLDD